MPLLTLTIALSAAYIALMLLFAVGMVWERPRAGGSSAQRRDAGEPNGWPSVDLVIAARNEASILPQTLERLRRLRYPGELRIVLVDDRSTDATPELLQQAAERDPRIRIVSVHRSDPALAPKVHAIRSGVESGHGDIVLTSDADCLLPSGWVSAMVAPFEDPSVVWGLAPVTTLAPPDPAGGPRSERFRERFEAIDWLSLILVSRSLARLGFNLASSANAQGYRRSALEAAGGFAGAGGAPSGDEELLLQRVGRHPGARTAFVDDPAAHVLTAPAPSWRVWLRQRRRWASRFRAARHYHPGFLAGIGLLAGTSLGLCASLLALPWYPTAAPALLGVWGVKVAVEFVGIGHFLGRIGRADLRGATLLLWSLAHPFFIAFITLGALLRPNSWTPPSNPTPRPAQPERAER